MPVTSVCDARARSIAKSSIGGDLDFGPFCGSRRRVGAEDFSPFSHVV